MWAWPRAHRPPHAYLAINVDLAQAAASGEFVDRSITTSRTQSCRRAERSTSCQPAAFAVNVGATHGGPSPDQPRIRTSPTRKALRRPPSTRCPAPDRRGRMCHRHPRTPRGGTRRDDMSMDAPSAAVGERTPGELVERLFAASLGMFDVMAVYLGDQLGLYRCPCATVVRRPPRSWRPGPGSTSDTRVSGSSNRPRPGSSRSTTSTAAPGDRRFSCPRRTPSRSWTRTSPYSIARSARSLVACAKVLPQLLTAFRTGGGVAWADYGADMIESQGDFNRPWLVNSFGSEILPAIPRHPPRLVADPPARVADVACGVGLGGDRHRQGAIRSPGRWVRSRRRHRSS